MPASRNGTELDLNSTPADAGAALGQRHPWIRLFAVLLIAAGLTACAARREPPPQPPPTPSGYPKPYRVFGTWYHPLPHARDFVQEGVASWYGREFHGRKTSNGEIYDMYGLTAAHKTLPMGTFVRVENLSNGRSLDLRINDRGPFARDRIIDLSYTAAERLGVVGPGTAPVRVTALGAPPATGAGSKAAYVPIDYYSGNFTFQVGAFAERANAERLVQRLQSQYKNAHITPFEAGERTFYRVRVGLTNKLEEATDFEQVLIRDGFPDTFIVAE
jgi:rare lipoprotein A